MAKNTLKKAAALQYDPLKDEVPLLTAFGQGVVAERMITMAEEAAVPIVQDANLANMLSYMNVGDEIPPELYGAIAQILVFISESDHAYGEKIKNSRRRN